jgi:hypothetical protein
LLCENPLLNEPGVGPNHTDMQKYNEIIEYANLDVAVCDILCKKEGVHLEFFQHFEPFVKENFLKNYDKLVAFAEKKYSVITSPTIFTTSFYTMTVQVNYKKVLDKLVAAKELFYL